MPTVPPRRRCLSLPELVDCRREFDESLPLCSISPGEFEWDNPFAWRIEYRCAYERGREDRELHGRAMGGNTEAEAILRLRKLLLGFGAVKILLYHVRPPATPKDAEAIRASNDQNQKSTIKNQT